MVEGAVRRGRRGHRATGRPAAAARASANRPGDARSIASRAASAPRTSQASTCSTAERAQRRIASIAQPRAEPLDAPGAHVQRHLLVVAASEGRACRRPSTPPDRAAAGGPRCPGRRCLGRGSRRSRRAPCAVGPTSGRRRRRAPPPAGRPSTRSSGRGVAERPDRPVVGDPWHTGVEHVLSMASGVARPTGRPDHDRARAGPERRA